MKGSSADGGFSAAALIPSLAIAVMQTGAAVSLAVLVFAGPATTHLATGASTFLLGSALTSLVLAWRSNLEVVVAGARNNVTVVIAAVAAGVAVQATDAPGPTVAVFVMIAALSSGLLLYVMGRFELGYLVRFVPYPVMGGYVAGTAWLMIKGGLQVMAGRGISIETLSDLGDPSVAQLWIPGVALAFMIVFVPGATRQSLIILGSLVGFHVLIRLVTTTDQVQADGWVIGPLPSGTGINLFQPSDVSLAQWDVIGSEAAGLAAIALIALTAALLNVSGVEFASGEQVDINHELRASGAASGLAGVVGGTVGFVALGPTLLARQLQASSRLVTAAFVCMAAVTILAGPGLVGWMPRFVAGAMIMGPGIALLRRWLHDSMLSGPRADRVVALVIPLTIAFVGVLEGVGLGIVVAAGLFIWRYSSIDPVRHATTGFALRSSVDRSPADTAILDEYGSRIAILRLEGFLFFGTAARLSERIVAELSAPSAMEHLVLDFRRVSGSDSSARAELGKLLRRCAEADVRVHLAAMPEELLHSFDGDPAGELAIADLDRALNRAELAVIDQHTGFGDHGPATTLPAEVLAYFARQSVPAGATLLATGHASNNLYVVEQGMFTVSAESKTGPVRLRQVGSGAFLGEVGFFSGSAALATVIADQPCIVYSLDRARYEQMTAVDPRLALTLTTSVLTKTTERLTITNALLRDLG